MSVVQLNGKHWLQELRGPQKANGAARIEASLQVRCVTRHGGCLIAETEALKHCNRASRVTSIVRRDASFVAIVKPVINLSTAFQKGHGVFFLAGRMADIVEHMVSSDILFDNSAQTYQRYIRKQSFLFIVPILSIFFKRMNGEEKGSRTLDDSYPNKGTFFSSRVKKGPLTVRAASQDVLNPKKHDLFHAPSFCKSGRAFCKSCLACTRNKTRLRALFFRIFPHNPFH